MVGDPALGLRAHRLPLGLSREREALADRRAAYFQGRAAAIARSLLWQPGAEPRLHRARLWSSGPCPASGSRHSHANREQPHGRDLPARTARVHRGIHFRQQPARRRHRRAVPALSAWKGGPEHLARSTALRNRKSAAQWRRAAANSICHGVSPWLPRENAIGYSAERTLPCCSMPPDWLQVQLRATWEPQWYA